MIFGNAYHGMERLKGDFYELHSLHGPNRSRTRSICYKYRTDGDTKPKFPYCCLDRMPFADDGHVYSTLW